MNVRLQHLVLLLYFKVELTSCNMSQALSVCYFNVDIYEATQYFARYVMSTLKYRPAIVCKLSSPSIREAVVPGRVSDRSLQALRPSGRRFWTSEHLELQIMLTKGFGNQDSNSENTNYQY